MPSNLDLHLHLQPNSSTTLVPQTRYPRPTYLERFITRAIDFTQQHSHMKRQIRCSEPAHFDIRHAIVLQGPTEALEGELPYRRLFQRLEWNSSYCEIFLNLGFCLCRKYDAAFILRN